MPITDNLPKTWYETNNLHLCTIKDFENLCTDMGFTIEKKRYLDIKSKEVFLQNYSQIFLLLKVFTF